MLTIEVRSGETLYIYADSQLTTEDYIDFVTRFDWFASGQSSLVSMLVELGPNFGGWDLDTLFRNNKFGLTPIRRIRRIAIVADERWRDWGSGPTYAALAEEIRFFERHAQPEADKWLRELRGGPVGLSNETSA